MNREVFTSEARTLGTGRSSRIVSGFVATALVFSGLLGAPAYADEDSAVDSPSIVAVTEEPTGSPTPDEQPTAEVPVLASSVPTISGTATFGKTLTAKSGVWTSGTTFSYQWNRNGKAISGAIAETYTLTATDIGATLTVKVTGTKDGYESVSTTSADTSKIAAATLKTVTPTISGSVRFGQTLTAKTGAWTSGTTYTYQWYRGGTPISGAKSVKYKLAVADIGKQITVKVTGSKSGYTTASKTSAKTSKVAKLTLKKATPKVSGTVKVGKTLTAKKGTWTTGTSFKYQWYRDGKAISKSTKSSYTLKAADAGKRISVKVTGSKSGYTTASKTSAKTAKVAKGTLKASKPSISGTVRVGSTVKAKTGTWTSDTKFSYQWYRNGTAISGAKSAKYKVKTADVGKRLTVKVTGKKSGYTTASKTSAGITAKNMTTGQKNAVASAKSYLSFMAFSRSGLIDQLKYEGYTKSEATFAVDYVAPSWNKQAVTSAKSYLSFMAFSRSGLIDQLKFEGFTSSQAKYGADHSGANWNKQAAKCAQEYMEYDWFSRQALLDQLLYEGFSKSQAQYGLRAVGY